MDLILYAAAMALAGLFSALTLLCLVEFAQAQKADRGQWAAGVIISWTIALLILVLSVA